MSEPSPLDGAPAANNEEGADVVSLTPAAVDKGKEENQDASADSRPAEDLIFPEPSPSREHDGPEINAELAAAQNGEDNQTVPPEAVSERTIDDTQLLEAKASASPKDPTAAGEDVAPPKTVEAPLPSDAEPPEEPRPEHAHLVSEQSPAAALDTAQKVTREDAGRAESGQNEESGDTIQGPPHAASEEASRSEGLASVAEAEAASAQEAAASEQAPAESGDASTTDPPREQPDSTEEQRQPDPQASMSIPMDAVDRTLQSQGAGDRPDTIPKETTASEEQKKEDADAALSTMAVQPAPVEADTEQAASPKQSDSLPKAETAMPQEQEDSSAQKAPSPATEMESSDAGKQSPLQSSLPPGPASEPVAEGVDKEAPKSSSLAGPQTAPQSSSETPAGQSPAKSAPVPAEPVTNASETSTSQSQKENDKRPEGEVPASDQASPNVSPSANPAVDAAKDVAASSSSAGQGKVLQSEEADKAAAKKFSKFERRVVIVLSVNQELIKLCVKLHSEDGTTTGFLRDVSHRLQTNLAFLASMAESSQRSSGAAAGLNMVTPRTDVFPHPSFTKQLQEIDPDSPLPNLYKEMGKLFEGVPRSGGTKTASLPGPAAEGPVAGVQSSRPPTATNDRKHSRETSAAADEPARKRSSSSMADALRRQGRNSPAVSSPAVASPAAVGFANPFANHSPVDAPGSATSSPSSARPPPSSPSTSGSSQPRQAMQPSEQQQQAQQPNQQQHAQLPPGMTPQQAQQLTQAFGPQALTTFRMLQSYLRSPNCHPQFASLPLPAQMQQMTLLQQRQRGAAQLQQQQQQQQQQAGPSGAGPAAMNQVNGARPRNTSFAGSASAASPSPVAGFMPPPPVPNHVNGLSSSDSARSSPGSISGGANGVMAPGFAGGSPTMSMMRQSMGGGASGGDPIMQGVSTSGMNPFSATNNERQQTQSPAMSSTDWGRNPSTPGGAGAAGLLSQMNGAMAGPMANVNAGQLPAHLQQLFAQQQMQAAAGGVQLNGGAIPGAAGWGGVSSAGSDASGGGGGGGGGNMTPFGMMPGMGNGVGMQSQGQPPQQQQQQQQQQWQNNMGNTSVNPAMLGGGIDPSTLTGMSSGPGGSAFPGMQFPQIHQNQQQMQQLSHQQQQQHQQTGNSGFQGWPGAMSS